MEVPKKRDGFEGQRAIVIPSKVLSKYIEDHPIIRKLYPTDIGYYPNALHHHRQRIHGVNQHILIYCVKGKGWARIGDKTYPISTGEFVLIPSKTPHQYGAEENAPWTIYWMHFKGTDSQDFIQMMLDRMGGNVASISFQENRIHLFEEIYTSLERGYSIDNICYASLSLQYFLGSCCFDNQYNYLITNEKEDTITLVINFLQNNLDKSLSLSEIATSVNLSASHFASIFKKSTGFSVIEYFNHMKTQKACQYLQFTDLRIAEIAGKLGVEDPYYFSRMFTKIIGMSPNQYRCRNKT
jgi:AraC-like DNA-binding protein